MATKKSGIYQVYNGTDFDQISFKSDASLIDIADAGNIIDATNVEDALQESFNTINEVSTNKDGSFKIKSAFYTIGTDTLSIIIAGGTGETFNDTTINTITKTTDTTFTINPVTASTTYTIYLKNDGNFDKSTDGSIATGSIIIGTISTNADKSVNTIVDKRPLVSGVGKKVSEHLAETATQAHLAKNIRLEDTTGNFVATDLEGAMSELFTNVSNGKSLVGGAITDVDDSVIIPTDPTFQDLASAIGQISTGKKWASGIKGGVVPGSFLNITGLTFKPSFIFVTRNDPLNWFQLGVTLYDGYNNDSRVLSANPNANHSAVTNNVVSIYTNGFNILVTGDGTSNPVEWYWFAIE